MGNKDFCQVSDKYLEKEWRDQREQAPGSPGIYPFHKPKKR